MYQQSRLKDGMRLSDVHPRERVADRLPAGTTTEAPKAPRLVQARLLTFGAEEPPVPQLAQYPGALHRGLKPSQQALAVLAVPERYEGQTFLLKPNIAASIA